MSDETPDAPDLETTTALLRVFVAGYYSGYASSLVSAGLPEMVARTFAAGVVREMQADPIARNGAADQAVAAFHNDRTKGARGVIPLKVCFCGQQHPDGHPDGES